MTRFYTTATTVALTPSYDANWNKTANAVRRLLSQSKLSTIATTSSDTEANAAAYNVLNRQLISKPLAAQTITGTVKGQIRASETDQAADMCRAMVIKVVSSDGATVRGTLLSHFPASLASEFAASLTNRNFPPSTELTSVEAQDGDYLVVEIGSRAFNTTTSSMGFSLRYQDGAAVSDLPEDETTTDDLCPWIEFSQDLLFQDKVRVYQALAQVEYTPVTIIQQTAKYQPGATGNTIPFTLGSTPTVDNLLIAFTAYSQYQATRTVSAPDGTWTKIQDSTNAQDSLAVWWKRVESGDGTDYTFNISGTDEWRAGVIYEITGSNLATPKVPVINGSASQINGSAVVTPSVIGTLALSAVSMDSGSGAIGSGWVMDEQSVPSYHPCVAGHRLDLTEDTSTPISAGWSPNTVTATVLVEFDDEVDGAIAATLEPLTAAGTGSAYPPGVGGTGSATLAALTAAGTGQVYPIGTGDAALAPLVSAGTGTVEDQLEPVVGAGEAYLAALTADGSETAPITGVGLASLRALTATGAGHYTLIVKGSASATLPALTALGEIPHLVTDLIDRETASGGFMFGGPPGEHEVLLTPETTAVQSKGGFLFGGRSRINFLFDVDLRPIQIVSSGGFLLRGSTTIAWVDPGAVPVLPIIGQGGFLFGGSDTEVALVDPPKPWQIQSAGGFLLGGSWEKPDLFLTPDIISIFPDNTPGGFLLGGQGTVEHLLPEITSIVSQGGGFCFAGYGIVNGGDEVSETWALNGFALEPSLYANFDFTTYAMFQGQAYGCREDGIYLLEGPDDNGEAIVSGLRLGPMNFGTERKKRLRLIRPGAYGVTARVAAGGEEEISQQEGDVIPVSRNVEGNEFVLDLQGFEQLGFVEVLPLVLMKR